MAEHSRLIEELKETVANALKVQEAAQATIASQNARILQQEAQIKEVCSRLDRLEARLTSDTPTESSRGSPAPLACSTPVPAQEAGSLTPFSLATATQTSPTFGPFTFESRHLPFDGGSASAAAGSPPNSAPAVPGVGLAPAGNLLDLLGFHDPQPGLAPVPHCTEANGTSAPANGLMDKWQVASPDLAQLGAAGAGTASRSAGPDARLTDLDAELRALPPVPQIVLQPQPPTPVKTPGTVARGGADLPSRGPSSAAIQLQRRGSALAEQALRFDSLFARELGNQELGIHRPEAQTALQMAGEQLSTAQQLMREAEESEALAKCMRKEGFCEKPEDLRSAEQMASSARAGFESAYSKLCSSLDSVACLVAVSPPQTHTNGSPPPGRRSASARSLPPVQRPDVAPPSTHSRPLLPGSLPSGVPRSGVGAVASQHGGGQAASGPLRSALERLSIGSRDAGSAASSPSRQRPAADRSATAARPSHRRTLSDETGIHSVSGGVKPKPAAGAAKAKERRDVLQQTEADPLELFNELEHRRLALYR